MNVVEILELIENTQGSNAKLEILERNASDLLKETFVAAGNPYANYGVVKFKMPPSITGRSGFGFDDPDMMSNTIVDEFLSLLRTLSRRDLSGNAAKEAIEEKFAEMTELEQKWCKRILVKKLRCGIATGQLDKVWPGTNAKKFSVSLAETIKANVLPGRVAGVEDDRLIIVDKIEYPVYVDRKLDGFRCVVIKKDGEVSMFSRNGKPLTTLRTITEAIKNAPVDDIMLDCEAVVDVEKDSDAWAESAKILASKTNLKDDSKIKLNVFDSMAIEEWEEQRCDRPFYARYNDTFTTVNYINHQNVIQVGGKIVKDETELLAFYHESVDAGYEGIMVKKLNAPYVFDRSDAIRKFKPVTTHELCIVGWYEGHANTKREGQFGGFIAVDKDGATTRVGGGFKDADRLEIATNGPETYRGRIMEVKGQFKTPDGKVRFPVFIRWRENCDVDPQISAAGEQYLMQTRNDG